MSSGAGRHSSRCRVSREMTVVRIVVTRDAGRGGGESLRHLVVTLSQGLGADPLTTSRYESPRASMRFANLEGFGVCYTRASSVIAEIPSVLVGHGNQRYGSKRDIAG